MNSLMPLQLGVALDIRGWGSGLPSEAWIVGLVLLGDCGRSTSLLWSSLSFMVIGGRWINYLLRSLLTLRLRFLPQQESSKLKVTLILAPIQWMGAHIPRVPMRKLRLREAKGFAIVPHLERERQGQDLNLDCSTPPLTLLKVV